MDGYVGNIWNSDFKTHIMKTTSVFGDVLNGVLITINHNC